ncbi:MAG: PC4/YdbC family ssDNA-binding protein [Treponema sp.]|nr:PC4/YdbC family ssDNA-binding protein [Treponema sp.]
MDSIKFDIIKHYGVLSSEKSGWKKELNLVSWNSRNPKLDIRDWAPDHDKMGKGVTLTEEEGTQLAKLLAAALTKEENS